MILIFLLVVVIIGLVIYKRLATKSANKIRECIYYHPNYTKKFSYEIDGLYKVYNPSLCKTETGYVCCYRYSSASHQNNFHKLKAEFYNRSKIGFIRFNRDFNHIEYKSLIKISIQNTEMEDPRIEYHNGIFFVSATRYNEKKGSCIPNLLIFDSNLNFLGKIDYEIGKYFSLNSPGNQKNWCPISYNGELFIHTDVFPRWQVWKMEKNFREWENIIDIDSRSFFSDTKEDYIRCSTSWKPFKPGYFLCGIHTKTGDASPLIRTSLIEVSMSSFLPTRKTPVLCIDTDWHNKIQFLAGLENYKDSIILGFGIADARIEFIRIEKSHIDKLLGKRRISNSSIGKKNFKTYEEIYF